MLAQAQSVYSHVFNTMEDGSMSGQEKFLEILKANIKPAIPLEEGARREEVAKSLEDPLTSSERIRSAAVAHHLSCMTVTEEELRASFLLHAILQFLMVMARSEKDTELDSDIKTASRMTSLLKLPTWTSTINFLEVLETLSKTPFDDTEMT